MQHFSSIHSLLVAFATTLVNLAASAKLSCYSRGGTANECLLDGEICKLVGSYSYDSGTYDIHDVDATCEAKSAAQRHCAFPQTGYVVCYCNTDNCNSFNDDWKDFIKSEYMRVFHITTPDPNATTADQDPLNNKFIVPFVIVSCSLVLLAGIGLAFWYYRKKHQTRMAIKKQVDDAVRQQELERLNGEAEQGVERNTTQNPPN